jgi:hypothetical protein
MNRANIVPSKMAQAEPVISSPSAHSGRENNKLLAEDYCVHDWYRFVLSYPPHLVRDYLGRFGVDGGSVVLDPFCGTGTTLVECKRLGFASVGIEANPMPCFASRVKTDWNVRPSDLLCHDIDPEFQPVPNFVLPWRGAWRPR